MPSNTSQRPGQPIDDPVDLSRDDYKLAAKRAFQELKDDDIPARSGGAAFRIFLSLFPSLLAAAAVFGLVTSPQDLQDMLTSLRQGVLPEGAFGVIESALKNLVDQQRGQALTAALLGIAGGVWAATSAAGAVMKALNSAYEVDEGRSFFKRRVIALLLTLALLATLVGLFVLLVVGQQLQSALVPEQIPGFVSSGISALRYVGAVGLIILLFAFTYWIGPNRDRPEWEWLSPGAVVGVIGWIVVSLLFNLYVSNFGNYGATYGAFAGVALLMLWLQLTMLFLLAGAEVNSELERVREHKRIARVGAGYAAVPPVEDIGEAEALGETAVAIPGPGPHPVVARPPRQPAREPRHATRRPSGSASGLAGKVGAGAVAVAALAFLSRRWWGND